MPSGTLWQSLLLEVLLTAALMFVITAVATDTRAMGELAALAIECGNEMKRRGEQIGAAAQALRAAPPKK